MSSHSLAPKSNKPNSVSSQTNKPKHAIAAFSFSGTGENAMSALLAALKKMQRIDIIEHTAGYIHATQTTRVLKFVDDMEFQLAESEQLIHLRSASRVGYSDLGANRKRIEELRHLFSSELTR